MNKTREQLLTKLYSIYIFIIKKLSNDIINTIVSCNTLIYNKIYIRVFEIYKDNTIEQNKKFTKYLYECVLGLNPLIDEEDKGELDLLIKEIISSESKLIAKHYILRAYFDYYISTNSVFKIISKKNIKTNFKKAKKYDLDIKLLRNKDYKAFKKDIKSELKDISNKIKIINKEKIKLEKEKTINPIEIKISNIIALISIFSALSLIGGIIYNQLLFYFLGLNATNFFNISDYISSSVDVLFIVFISMAIAIPFYFLKTIHLLDEQILDDQLGTNIQIENNKKESIIKWFMYILLILVNIALYIKDKEINFDFLLVLIYTSIIFSLPKLGFMKYIKNSYHFALSILIILNFLFLIISKAHNEKENIKTDNYNNKYKIVLKEKNNNKYSFIQSNSNYTFLFNKNENKVIIIHNNEIERIEVLLNE